MTTRGVTAGAASVDHTIRLWDVPTTKKSTK